MNEIQRKMYAWMLFSRYFEELTEDYWDRGRISGELHMGIGEEGICAGVIAHLEEGDSLALDHRSTPPMLMRNVDPRRIMLECMGHEEGICQGRGGHMHLLSRENLMGASGIVGSSGPLAAGFALASTFLRKGKIAVSFFGEGAVNQGMLMESFNLAVAWNLPVLFVCKDNGWAITTQSEQVTGGDLTSRAKAFGLHAIEANGSDVMDVYEKSQELIRGIRDGRGPGFLHADCVHPRGHFLGDPLVKMKENPLKGMLENSGEMTSGATSLKGGSLKSRWKALKSVADAISSSKKDLRFEDRDPLKVFRRTFAGESDALDSIEQEVSERVAKLKQDVEDTFKEGRDRK